MSINIRVGHQLRSLRLERGLTRKQLGRKVGLTRLGIARIENGSNQTRINTIVRIAKALGGKIQIAFRPDSTFADNNWI